MRIVTRPDYDGIVCAVLLFEALDVEKDVFWLEPNEIQAGTADIRKGDILANLPFHPAADLWFDHHVSNRQNHEIRGFFEIAPSAAGLVYRYFQKQGKLDSRFDDLVAWTDAIDSADLTKEQVAAPENYPHILLSMTVKNTGEGEIPYWNRLVELLGTRPVEQVLPDTEVKKRCDAVIGENNAYGRYLRDYTTVEDGIAITDFRSLETVPSGNRFLTYSMFPETIASIKIRYKGPAGEQVLISIGRSIFNPGCKVNIGHLLARYGGGGHAGAGGCTLTGDTARKKVDEIIGVMKANQPI